MLRSLIIIAVLLASRSSDADLVFIPDTNFSNVLIIFMLGVFDANRFLDTQQPAALDLESLWVFWTPTAGPCDPMLPLHLPGIEALTGDQAGWSKTRRYCVFLERLSPWITPLRIWPVLSSHGRSL